MSYTLFLPCIRLRCRPPRVATWVFQALIGELASLQNFTYPADIFSSRYFYKQDIAMSETVLSGPGEMAARRSQVLLPNR